MVSLPEVEDELVCRTPHTKWSPSETLGWSKRMFCTGKFPLIMVSGGQMWDMQVSWKGFCKVVLGMLMSGCSSFPCPSRTIVLTRTGIVCVCVVFFYYTIRTQTVGRTSMKSYFAQGFYIFFGFISWSPEQFLNTWFKNCKVFFIAFFFNPLVASCFLLVAVLSRFLFKKYWFSFFSCFWSNLFLAGCLFVLTLN